MLILFYTDVHWCDYSSILRQRGNKYSVRLENLIKSINWVEQLALDNNCDRIICLGDFFDKSELNAEELTALKEVKFNNLPHYFIVGNHESNVNSLVFNSSNTLNKDGFHIIDKVQEEEFDNFVLDYIPYTLEENRKSIKDTFKETLKKRIILSHNDIKGINYGQFVSKVGYDIKDIENNCDLFLNGHLHNGSKFCENGYNLGNLTGLNFSEDALKYKHSAFILDTDNLKLKTFLNPYALNFYKLEINVDKDLSLLNDLKNNAVVSIKCNNILIEKLKSKLENNIKILTNRILIYLPEVNNINKNLKNILNSVDHLEQFKTFVLSTLENTEELKEELSEVLK